jgi:hypothetical protein
MFIKISGIANEKYPNLFCYLKFPKRRNCFVYSIAFRLRPPACLVVKSKYPTCLYFCFSISVFHPKLFINSSLIVVVVSFAKPELRS